MQSLCNYKDCLLRSLSYLLVHYPTLQVSFINVYTYSLFIPFLSLPQSPVSFQVGEDAQMHARHPRGRAQSLTVRGKSCLLSPSLPDIIS